MTFVIESIETEAYKRPNAVALLLEDGRKLSYRELSMKSDEISSILNGILQMDQYLSPDLNPLVTVMMNRDVGFIVSILGIIKSGAAYVPVDPTFPPDRQSHILTHSKSSILLIDKESMHQSISLNVSMPQNVFIVDAKTGIIIDRHDHPITASTTFRRLSINKDSLAYVLYTSGSTGKPKGVMVKNIGVANIIDWFANALNVNYESKVLCLTTFCFDISVLEMFVPLTRGAVLVLADSSTQKDPFHLIDLLKLTGVTVFQATPTTYEMMLATGWTGDESIDFLVGGEAFRPSLNVISNRCRSLRNVYGPTETTIWSSSYTIPRGFISSSVPIGKPISDTTFYVVKTKEDSDFSNWTLVNDNEEGELWIGGVGVAKGYLHAANLTADKFLPNPFGSGTVYRTGDIVRCLNTGDYIFVRRMDEQVKINGFRIELQEIESVYMKHDKVDQAVSLVRNGKLVVYLKLKTSDSSISQKQWLENIKVFVSRSLTYYMVPTYTMVVPTFPMTANGKLDKNKLPDPNEMHSTSTIGDNEVKGDMIIQDEKECDSDQSDSTLLNRYINSKHNSNPVTSVASHLCKIVEKLKGVKTNMYFTFASLGVDSLTAVMFVKQISDNFGGIRIDPSLVFAPGMTIQLFAVKLEEKLIAEKPEIFEKLGITKSCDISHEHTSRNSMLSGGSDFESEDGNARPLEIDAAFEVCIASNLRLIEGVRGVFALLILWDHYHPQDVPLSGTWGTDTGLFVLLSGFVTALQLRVSPKFELDPNTRKNVLQPRVKFNWFHFLVTRAMGIFPVLWFAMVLCAPFWYDQDNPKNPAPGDLHVPHAPGLPQSYACAMCTGNRMESLYILL